MLTEIREKAQGAFAWFILIAITIPFALWGIQNYIDTGKESAVASVGSKDFYQRDVNRAYEQYAQNFQGMKFDEQMIKKQALDKLVKDEVMLQYVNKVGLVATDSSARDFIKNLPYFQTDGKFDDQKYKNLLNSQRLAPTEFTNRIKSALVMEQFQHSIVDSGFATQYQLDNFFKIQNQQRDADYVTVALEKPVEQPSEQDITAYYQKHQDAYKLPEQVAIEYVELSLAEIAKKIEVNDDKLHPYYDEQKEQYTTPEKRKISHILFAVNSKTDDKTALAKATKTEQDLKSKDFAALAKELSDDKQSAKNGGDLGIMAKGAQEKSFEDAALGLKANEVSKPIRTAFGYHLIKVTELTPSATKPFEEVKTELTKNFQKSQAENAFYEAGEKLSQLSFESPDNLQAVSQKLNLTIQKTGLFSKDKGEGIAADQKIRDAAFSEEVLQGNNSSTIELGNEKLVVLRNLEHKPAAVRSLAEVKSDVIAALNKEKAAQLTLDKANKIKQRLQAGEELKKLAAEFKLEVKSANGLKRIDSTLPEQLNDAIFSASKPNKDKTTNITVPLPNGDQVIASIKKVTPGTISDDDKLKLDLAKRNLAKAYGQNEFGAMLATLEANADVTIRTQK